MDTFPASSQLGLPVDIQKVVFVYGGCSGRVGPCRPVYPGRLLARSFSTSASVLRNKKIFQLTLKKLQFLYFIGTLTFRLINMSHNL